MFVNFNILNQLGSPAINSNTFANRPAAGQTGRLFVSTDTFEIYRDNGTTWDLIGGPGSSTITGTGTATQVAYFTSSQAIGSSANLYWDNTNGYLGVGTATPGARIEAVKTDGYGIYANYTTNAGSGASTTAIYAINNTASSGYAAVIEEKTGNTTGGQYPLLVKHSLSSGTAAVGNGTGLQFQLQDDAGAFKTTQLTIETIDAAAATYATRYRFNVQSAGSSTPAAYLNATGLGLGTATPGAKLDIHSTGTLAQFNTTGATTNAYIAFQRTGTGLWRLGDTYNSGNNFFELHNTVLAIDALEFEAATNKSTFQAQQTYSTGLARGNYFDYNLSVAAGASFSSPNAITALGASLDLTLAGNATIPSGARTGLDAYNTVSFTGAGTLTMTQGTQIRPYSNVTAGWAFNGSAVGTITHLAGLRILFPDNSGSTVNVTNNYALLINDQTANTGTVSYTSSRWGIYQEGASDLNYFAGNTLIGSTVNSGYKLNVAGSGGFYGSNAGGNFSGVIVDNTAGGAGVNTASLDFANGGSVKASIKGAVYGNGYMTFSTNDNTEKMRITASGYLGIGTTTPGVQLDVNNSGNPPTASPGTVARVVSAGGTGFDSIFSIIGGNAGRSLIDFGDTDSAIPGRLIYDHLSDFMSFQTNGSEKARITSGGNFGLGTTTPVTTLGIFGSTSTTLGYSITPSGWNNAAFRYIIPISGDTGMLSYNYNGSVVDTSAYATSAIYLTQGLLTFATGAVNTAPTERMRITTNLLIGTTTDNGNKLQVSGSGWFTGGLKVGTATGASGNLTVRGTGTTSATYSFEAADVNGTSIFVVRDDKLTQVFDGNFEVRTGTIKTSAPTSGTAAEWKLGSKASATVALDTANYIQVEIGGVAYKLALVN
jgi:hypothetical protein